jgi:hypothetical protein
VGHGGAVGIDEEAVPTSELIDQDGIEWVVEQAAVDFVAGERWCVLCVSAFSPASCCRLILQALDFAELSRAMAFG